jgi:hypothetical protein
VYLRGLALLLVFVSSDSYTLKDAVIELWELVILFGVLAGCWYFHKRRQRRNREMLVVAPQRGMTEYECEKDVSHLEPRLESDVNFGGGGGSSQNRRWH